MYNFNNQMHGVESYLTPIPIKKIYTYILLIFRGWSALTQSTPLNMKLIPCSDFRFFFI